MKSQIFVQAAEKVDTQDHTYACLEIEAVMRNQNNYNPVEAELYCEYFCKLFGVSSFTAFFTEYKIRINTNVVKQEILSELKEMRVLALLLTAEIVKSEMRDNKKKK